MTELLLEEGTPVPANLFCVEGASGVCLEFALAVRLVRAGTLRHVYPTRRIRRIEDVVEPRSEPPTHLTIAEGPNTVCYRAPRDRLVG